MSSGVAWKIVQWRIYVRICAYALADQPHLGSQKQLDLQKDTFLRWYFVCMSTWCEILEISLLKSIEKTSYRGIIRLKNLHRQSSDNGCRLINLAANRELIIRCTCFSHKIINKDSLRGIIALRCQHNRPFSWFSPDLTVQSYL